MKNHIKNQFDEIKKEMPKNLLNKINELENSVNHNNEILEKRINNAEHFAAIGIVAKGKSHNMNSYLGLILNYSGLMKRGVERKNYENFEKYIDRISKAYEKIKEINKVYYNKHKEVKDVNIKESLDLVINMYKRVFEDNKVNIEIIFNENLIVSSTEAGIAQLFVNLFDNSLSEAINNSCSNVLIKVNSKNKTIIYSDNGKGVPSENNEYIFDSYFTTNDDGFLEGRPGMGLTIAKHILEKHGHKISLITNEDEKLLSGANFKIEFSNKGE